MARGQVPAVERAAARAGPTTLAHGDVSARNLRTGPDSEIAFIDWEDVSAEPGIGDLAWLLLSSVEPGRWDEVIAAYGRAPEPAEVLLAAVSQALLSLADVPEESPDAIAWIARVEAASLRAM